MHPTRRGLTPPAVLKHLKLLFVPMVLLSVILSAAAGWAEDHSQLTYQGPRTCLSCHEAEAREVHGSAHYQWQGEAPYAVNGPVLQGKLNSAFNSYCVNILGNWNACGTCHVGLGARPEPTATTAQLENIDCLVCHQKAYKRKKVNGVFVPDTANMTITIDQAVQTVHKPERSNCLQCHAKGGGGDNNKRGDLALAQTSTSDRNFDVHMATTGANLSCQECHTTQNHRIAGRGSDLRETDLNVKMNCSTSSCHTDKLSSSGHETTAVNRHINKVACQTCHIKSYARNAADTAANESTELYRDWSTPEWNAALNRFEPAITRANDLTPAYAFWNGFSWNYSLGEAAAVDPATGAYPTSRPVGGINDAGSKLYPFKYKKALQPMATTQGRLIALDTSVYFGTGDLSAATKQGLTNMGLSGSEPYSLVETDTYQLITHEVPPSSQALSCNGCHGTSTTQMDLKALGYVLKAAKSEVCTQCHSLKDKVLDYVQVHQIHVTNKKFDCANCHNFTRQTGGSTPPPAEKYTLTVSKSGRGRGTVTSTPSGISCGRDCSESYAQGTAVVLRATPDPRSEFTGWSGSCSGTGDCVVTISGNTQVTATFGKKSR